MATIQLIRCNDPWQPVSAEVCVTPAVGAPKCAKGYGFNVVQAYHGATSATGEFTAAGRGCVRRFGLDPVCIPLGPVRATL